MHRFLAGLCCVIVVVQLLIGVPLAVGVALIGYFGGDLLGPLSVEFRVSSQEGHGDAPAVIDQPSQSPDAAAQDDSILAARQERGSLLAGTLLDQGLSPDEEQREFVAAFRQVAEEAYLPTDCAPANQLPSPVMMEVAGWTGPVQGSATGAGADRFAVEQLYAMAERDEDAHIYARADQWRNLARTIRSEIDGQATSEPAVPPESEQVARRP